MSDFVKKIKEDVKAVSAAIDQELTVLEGVDGFDALAPDRGAEDFNGAPQEATAEE
ncbi:hypothetical protein QSJ18_12210 [Gordonia sp. ABSL1-1]|uniref:hypothetical protein n=1 Tax=Gordonia sp. ABSL1-1 TaxID=3053923 RepID=UPI0025729B2B|nr:hypothetical protein [Gordonia sp. ABSL1-1]MDL9937511.1 hypothetical protein [Gordonia sp. ABSL1-1]